MNIAQNNIVVFLFSIFSYCWIISGTLANNVIDQTNQLRTNEEWKHHQKIYSLRSPRHLGKSTKCDCNCNCGHAGITESKSCIISALEDVIKLKLMEMNLVMKIFRGNFQGAALLHSMVGAPSGTLPWDSLLTEYSDVNNTLSSLLEIFNRVFNMSNIMTPSGSTQFISELRNRTKQWLHLRHSPSYTASSGEQNMGNIISFIQKRIESGIYEFLNYAMESNNIALGFMNWTRKIFSQVNKSSSTNRDTKNFMDSVTKKYESVLTKIMNSRLNSNDFSKKLQNQTIEMLKGFNVKLSGEQISRLFQSIITTPAKPIGSLSVAEQKVDFNWRNIINRLKTWLVLIKDIPKYIVQLFKSVKESLMVSNLSQRNWHKMETSPLFVGQCYSSRIKKIMNIPRHKQSHMPYVTSKSWKLKPKHVSFWERLKNLLNRECNCP